MKNVIDPELALSIVRNSPVIAYDTETNGLEITSFICGHVITNFEHSVYVPLRHEQGGNIPDPDGFEKDLADAFNERARLGYRTVGHNLGFDLRIAGRHGIFPKSPLEDTMINEGLIWDITKGFGLDDLSKRYGVEVQKKGADLYVELARRFGGLPDRKSMQHFWRMPGDDPLVVEYACDDGTATLQVWAKQQKILDEEELRTVHKLECDLIPYVARIHLRGMKVDHDYANKLLEPGGQLDTMLKAAKGALPPGLNVRSSGEVEKLYLANGFDASQFERTPPTKNKPEGSVSFREKWLETNEIGKLILEVRRLEKMGDSFIKPLVETHNLNGRVHPILNQSKSDEFGVIGARFSCSDPNMQAYPKRNKKIGKMVRPLVVPDHDMLIEEGDAKQQEPRLFAHYSDEPKLVEGYRSGTIDIHGLADSFFHLGRDTSKRLAMGMLTGMQPKALAGHMSWDIERATRAHRLFLTEAFPLIGEFQKQAKSVFYHRGYVKSILGRRARLDDPRFAYRAVSRIIQNSGGDHAKLCLLRLCQYEDAHPNDIQALMTIHDSFIWQRSPRFGNEELIRILENVPNELGMSVPVPFDVGSGENWGVASYGK